MSNIIDRRQGGRHKSAVNRERFIRRFKHQIKKAVTDAISKRSITDIERGESITIPSKDLSEPTFGHTQGGRQEAVHPGNKEFITGDKVQRPDGGAGQGGGGEASNEGEGTDDFGFEISREEFLELFFEDLELPDLVKKRITREPAFSMVRAGITNDGIPANLNVIRSMRSALGRRIALRGPYKKKLEKLEEELKNLKADNNSDDSDITRCEQEIKTCKRKINAIPFIDNIDLRYNNRVKRPIPTTQAVMFCLMDVSGSMDEAKKEIAKRFFIMLYLFLNRNYKHIEVVFIRHHTSAKEVEEEEFFYSRETGGTVVSSALELNKDLIQERYPTSDWNIYVAQASDGDNWNADSPYCRDLLLNDIMPYVQYFAYIEILPRHHQSLWHAYLEVKEAFPNFAMQSINDAKDIYPVFRELFKRQPA